ncbi:isoquinoline 1-oxidoreductase subunit alpha [Alcanivorax xiamenensis]|uniref:Isoquinoline 1-oxidoreductase subunit alpha n=1 Tax=Alcanivorax xiamenensis TaxID=1177156 RepID=A0ABQ6YD16_9GAMM|nr:(2Fe-2S)-binding protein [Alcanivorax xiamenensis]KAF0808108.1 isoquinoline 1-oxidoreductase subunit alpha [Alcanivorax xiamenensis]
MTQLKINGKTRDVEVAEEMPLLWVLRDELGMTGTKFGCGMALCGACTVHLDGAPIRSCVTPASAASGREISTIEGMASDRVGQVVQQAWVEHNVAQCGYCQAGQIMTAVGLLKKTPAPTEEQIDGAMGGNICRCGTYPRIRAAIKQAAGRLAQGGE